MRDEAAKRVRFLLLVGLGGCLPWFRAAPVVGGPIFEVVVAEQVHGYAVCVAERELWAPAHLLATRGFVSVRPRGGRATLRLRPHARRPGDLVVLRSATPLCTRSYPVARTPRAPLRLRLGAAATDPEIELRVVAHRRDEIYGGELWVTDALGYPGMSGLPVLDADGALAGLVIGADASGHLLVLPLRP